MCYHVRGTLCQFHHKSGLSRPTGGRRQAVASTRYEFDPKFRMDPLCRQRRASLDTSPLSARVFPARKETGYG
jgi:hypothetical protein